MQKKIISGVLALLMTLTACGNNQEAATNTEKEENKEAASTENKTEEVVEEEKDPETKELKKVTVVLDYTPNTNHTGL